MEGFDIFERAAGEVTDYLCFDSLPSDKEECYEQYLGPFSVVGGTAGTHLATPLNPPQSGVVMRPGFSLSRSEIVVVAHNPTGLTSYTNALALQASVGDALGTPTASDLLMDFPKGSGAYYDWSPWENTTKYSAPVIHEVLYPSYSGQLTQVRSYTYDWHGLEGYDDGAGGRGSPKVFWLTFDVTGTNEYRIFIRQYYVMVGS